MYKLLFASISSFALLASASFAQNSAERYAREMAKYKQTGTFENCIRHSSIRRTKVLDDKHIIFEMRGKKTFLNTLDHKCHSLGFLRKVGYSVHGNRLCSYDSISVLDDLGPRGACGLGKFELLEKLPENNEK